MFKHILVPLDGSSFGEGALPPALALAPRARAMLTLVSVQDVRASSAVELPYQDRETYLAQIAESRGLLAARSRTVVRLGHPADQILEEAESCGADLIVMSTHGRGGVTRLWLGSVADQLLRHARISVLLYRPRPSAHRAEGEGFLPPRVIVPLDGGEEAERALPQATALAQAFGARVQLLRVVPGERSTGAEPIGAEPTGGAAEAEALAYLDVVAKRLWSLGLPTSTRVVGDLPPAEAIIAEAAGDPVVMSTHARSPVVRAFLGSVADKVVRGGRGAVVLVPPRVGATTEQVRPSAAELAVAAAAGGASRRVP